MKDILRPTRREFVGVIGGAAAAVVAAPYVAKAQSKGTVVYATFSAYSDPRLIGDANDNTGLDLKVQSIGSVDSLVAKITATQGEGLDVVSIANFLTRQLYEQGVIEPIDTSRLKNWNTIFPEFQKAKFLQTGMDGKVIGFPFAWGPEGLIYRTDKIDHADSWHDLFDERYKGRVAMPNWGYENVLIAASTLGYHDEIAKDPVEFSDQQYAAIKAKLIEQKKLVTKYWGGVMDGASLIVSGEAWVNVGRLAMRGPAREEGAPIKLLAPKEGAFGWCTSNCIMKASKNKDGAYALLDYMAGNVYQHRLSTLKGYPSINRAMHESLPTSLQNDLTLDDPNLLTSMKWMNKAADLQRVTALWNAVKAS